MVASTLSADSPSPRTSRQPVYPPVRQCGRGPRTGAIGLIDWSAANSGPLLYDVASAVMYAGDGLVEAYLRTGTLTEGEVATGLSTMLRRYPGDVLRVADGEQRPHRDRRR